MGLDDTVTLIVDYNSRDDAFNFGGSVRPERRAEVIEEYLRTQVGAGEDKTPPTAGPYNITLSLDLSSDTYRVQYNTGNKGLRDGILLHALDKLRHG